jgi:anti-sigma regulatory factor (Ser/Thr protein kinase)
VTVVLQDITRLRRFDELKDDLVATVAHEFRTPLTSLRMAIHLLAEQTVGPLGERQLDLVTAAREECERLQSIVDDLLDLARIRSGQLELHPRSLSSHRAIGEAVEAVRTQADQAGVAVSVEVDPAAASITADPDRIELALGNLLINAVRHSRAGGQVTVHALRGDDGVRIEVQDEGPGIAPEHQARLFEKFYRIPGSPPGGAGLGLSIVRDVVEAHGGRVGVSSGRGQGSSFWIELPDQSPLAHRFVALPLPPGEASMPRGFPPPPGWGWRRVPGGCSAPPAPARRLRPASPPRRGGGDALGNAAGGRRSAGQTMAARSTAFRSSPHVPRPAVALQDGEGLSASSGRAGWSAGEVADQPPRQEGCPPAARGAGVQPPPPR